ncbi:MAG: YopX family protein [Ruminococcus sp.]|nr:YopX family protein [Ruminococcus sp.]
MREILFSGKRTYNGKWVEGSLVIEGDNAYIIGKNETAHPALVLVNSCSVEVDPKTIGQYTGLTDENGAKIYEGDIVTVMCPNIPEDEYGIVKYNDNEAVFEIEFDGFTINFTDNVNSSDVEIIGNIHDNPELTGGKNQ